MFSGFQEMLLIGLIIVGILILPRILKPQPSPAPRRTEKKPKLTWTLRLAIVLTILWPLCWALYFKPWQQTGLISFVAVGIVPITIYWCIKWILAGMQTKGRAIQKEAPGPIKSGEKYDP